MARVAYYEKKNCSRGCFINADLLFCFYTEFPDRREKGKLRRGQTCNGPKYQNDISATWHIVLLHLISNCTRWLIDDRWIKVRCPLVRLSASSWSQVSLFTVRVAYLCHLPTYLTPQWNCVRINAIRTQWSDPYRRTTYFLGLNKNKTKGIWTVLCRQSWAELVHGRCSAGGIHTWSHMWHRSRWPLAGELVDSFLTRGGLKTGFIIMTVAETRGWNHTVTPLLGVYAL